MRTRRERLLQRLVNVQADLRRARAHHDEALIATLQQLHGELHDHLIDMDRDGRTG